MAVGVEIKGDRRLISADYDGGIGLFGLRRDRETQPHLVNFLPGCHDGEVLCMIFSSANGLIYTAGNDCVIKAWDERQVLNRERQWRPVTILQAHADAVSCLSIDGFLLFSGSDDGDVTMWDTSVHIALATFDTWLVRQTKGLHMTVPTQ